MYKPVIQVWVRGQQVELYTIGHTAKLLKRSVETLRAWERDKTIPKPMFRKNQVRLYHPLEVEAMKKVLKKLGKQPRKEELRIALWKALAEVRQGILDEQTPE